MRPLGIVPNPVLPLHQLHFGAPRSVIGQHRRAGLKEQAGALGAVLGHVGLHFGGLGQLCPHDASHRSTLSWGTAVVRDMGAAG